MRFRNVTDQIEVRADGSSASTGHCELQVLNATLAARLAQFPLIYSEALSDVSIVEAYTLKSDGRKIPVEPGGIVTQDAPGPPLSTLFTDLKRKIIIFPHFEAGDTLVFTKQQHNKQPYFPGQYFDDDTFSRSVATDQTTVTISVPRNLTVALETHGVEFQKSISGDNIVYTMHFSNPEPQPEETGAVSAKDRVPRYFISTFKSYEELGRAYSQLVAPKIVITPKIQAQTDTITQGITDRREQARAIYEWVSQRVRYVAVLLGQGALVPHDADTVLANAYGDCKDQVVLLSALLKAKGISCDPVLINSTNGYTLSSVPTLAQLNHLITWLPDFGIYADPTANFLPFGTLALSEYGKPVLLAGTEHTGLRQTPVLPAGAGMMTFRSVVTLDDKMLASAESTTAATGVFASQLRQKGISIQGNGPERVAADLLTKQGTPQATGTFDVGVPASFAPEYAITGRYSTLRPLNIRMMPTGFRLLPHFGGFLIGALANTKLKDDDPTPCYSGHTIEDLSLVLPDGKCIAKLPENVDVKTAHFQYASQWSMSGQTVAVHRDFTAFIDQPLCGGEVRKEAADVLASIQRDYDAPIVVVSSAPDSVAKSVGSGERTKVDVRARRSQGRDWPVTIKMISPPAHGQVTTQFATGKISGSGGSQVGSTTQIYYQSDPGYVGSDSFTYQRNSEDATDPLSGSIRTINVDVK